MQHECLASLSPHLFLCASCVCPPLHQAVVLTHTGATAAEMEPYLTTRLRPLTPVVLYGREGQAEPVCHPHGVRLLWLEGPFQI